MISSGRVRRRSLMELEKLVGVAAGKVGAAYGAGEEGVSGDQKFLVGEVEAELPWVWPGVWRTVAVRPCDGDGLVVGEVGVGWGDLGVGMPSQPAWRSIILTRGRSSLVVEDGGSGEALERWAPAMWSMWAWVMTICLTVRWWRARVARMREMSSPGSTTMASWEVSSPRMEQLHWSGPTTRISWIMG